MALKISKETALGVNATYWRIPSYQIDFDGKEFSCLLKGYIDEGKYLQGASPLVTKSFTVRFERNANDEYYALYLGHEPMLKADEFPFPFEIDRVYLYGLLLNNVPFFCGAENG